MTQLLLDLVRRDGSSLVCAVGCKHSLQAKLAVPPRRAPRKRPVAHVTQLSLLPLLDALLVAAGRDAEQGLLTQMQGLAAPFNDEIDVPPVKATTRSPLPAQSFGRCPPHCSLQFSEASHTVLGTSPDVWENSDGISANDNEPYSSTHTIDVPK